MAQDPLVSVIIPTHNRASLLPRAIESVLSQTRKDWELVMVDDGSSDNTREVVRSYCEQDGRIHYLGSPRAGVCAARNTGLARATGRFVAFLDDDDYWLPEKLEHQVEFMEQRPEIGVTYTRATVELAPGVINGSRLYPKDLINTFEDLLNWPNGPVFSSMMIRRRCFDGAGWFDLRYAICEDFDLKLRYAQRWGIAGLDRLLTIQGSRDGRSQLTGDMTRNQLAAIQVLGALPLIPRYRHLHRLRNRHIARIHYQLAGDYFDLKRYREAGMHFLKAVVIDPLVGLMVRRPDERGLQLLLRIGKSYAAPPVCLMRALKSAIAGAGG